jgi:prevent-host-death family protein
MEAAMKLATRVKPISYLKAHAAEIIDDLAETGDPMVITQNGEAKVVIQDVASYEMMQETLALLKILALTHERVKNGDVLPVGEAFARLRDRVKS